MISVTRYMRQRRNASCSCSRALLRPLSVSTISARISLGVSQRGMWGPLATSWIVFPSEDRGPPEKEAPLCF